MTRIAVFGETLVDQFPNGPVVGGAPFNVARHLAGFGQQPLMLSAVGSDANAQRVLDQFDRYGMRRDGIQHLPQHATGVVDVQTGADGSHAFVIRGNCAWDMIEEAPARLAVAGIGADSWLYCANVARHLRRVRRMGVRRQGRMHRAGPHRALRARGGYRWRRRFVFSRDAAWTAAWLGDEHRASSRKRIREPYL